MRTYKLTAYEKTGKLITEETFTAETDDAAKEKGQTLLEEQNLLEQTHRLTSPAGKLLLFHI
ncbi:YhzD family protein [Sporosarcina oncorhynchi]|uniref:YhzD family protein n=1 Tax=Sporosarcina oncorhynchi TaxID=3056444 RepID=A0ABZ0L4L8_9BACL|nr:YhzD family protein [Sporosarcina sp. T2O-4]WOV86577.1 YhzD family protein [Sporosarcina sp. T2O-4]